MVPARELPRVVIVGAGFGGLQAARSLSGAPLQVTLLDRTNHHLFQPLLYQVATAGLSGAEIAAPIRKILRGQRNATVVLADATRIDLAGRRVLLEHGELAYDFLILATGVATSYFGHDAWARHAPGLKTLSDAVFIRSRVLLAFEAAEREVDAVARRAWLRFVVIGGGPTGVELAGALAELARHTLPRDFRNFDPKSAEILLVEGGDRVLPTFPAELSARAQRDLERLGVRVRTRALVTDVRADGLSLGSVEILARTVLWAAGVRATPLTATLGVELDRSGRVLVAPELSIPGGENVFVIGDAAVVRHDGAPVPGVAPAAIQMGRHAARQIRRALSGEPALPFRYRDRGALATIGRMAAVAEIGRLRFSGPLAWLVWLTLHIYFLIGFRSRLVVLIDWAWSWLTYQRVARVVPDRLRPNDGALARERQSGMPAPPDERG
jgi:NADH dehydrogenase